MLTPHPYRTRSDGVDAAPPERRNPYGIALLVGKLFLIEWALMRIVICAARGFDAQGFAAVLIIVSAATAAACPRGRRRVP